MRPAYCSDGTEKIPIMVNNWWAEQGNMSPRPAGSQLTLHGREGQGDALDVSFSPTLRLAA